MNTWLLAAITWALVVFITSYAKTGFSWGKVKNNWATNHKATAISLGVSAILTVIMVYNGGFSVLGVVSVVSISAISELVFNRGDGTSAT